MAAVESWTLLKDQLEDYLDYTKVVVLSELARDGSLEGVIAEEWAATHTVIVRKKRMFRTLTDRWLKARESDSYRFIVVKMDKRNFDVDAEKEVEDVEQGLGI